jgi:cytochrome c
MERNTLIGSFFACALFAAISIARATLASADAPLHADVARGKALYQGCQACHSIDGNDLGPRHRGVVGRRAGGLEELWLDLG